MRWFRGLDLGHIVTAFLVLWFIGMVLWFFPPGAVVRNG